MYEIDKINFLQIGVQGENIARKIEIDMTKWVEDLEADNVSGYSFGLIFKPYNDPNKYPMVTTYDEETHVLTWRVSNAATQVSGVGYTEVRAQEATSGLVKKTRIIPTAVEDSVSGNETEPPESQEEWVSAVLNSAAAVLASAQGKQVKFEIDEDTGHLMLCYSDDEEVTVDTEWTTVDLGAVNAYAMAVLAGYTGTAAQFEQYMADIANGASAAAASASAAAASAADALQHTQSVIETWLGNNIDPDSGYALDRTLALSSAAAPADMVGALKSAIENIGENVFLTGSNTDSYRDVTVTRTGNVLSFSGTASGNVRFKLNGDIAHAVSVQSAWYAASMGIKAGAKKIIVKAGQSNPDIVLSIYGTDGTVSLSIPLANITGTGVYDFTVTDTNCACVVMYIASGTTVTGLTLSFMMVDTANLNLFLAQSRLPQDIADVAAHAPAHQNSVFGLYGNYPTIKKSGYDLIVTIPSNSAGRAVWNNGYVQDAETDAQTIPVGHAKYLVYNTSSKVLRVETATSNFTKDDIIVLYNSHGAAYGQWAVYLVRSEIEESKKEIPDYYHIDDYIDDIVDSVNTIGLGLGQQSSRSIFVTDYHLDWNARISPMLIKYLIKKTGIRNVVFGGDGYTKDTSSKLGGYNKLCGFLTDFNKVNEDADVYYITGNHEYNDPSSSSESLRLSRSSVFHLLNEPNHNIVHCFNYSNSFYYDDESVKIRTYCIDCEYDSTVLTQANARWEVFDSMLEVPEGYAVIIYSHAGQTHDGSYIITGVNGRFGQLLQCAAAMNDGISVDITIGSTTKTYNFTNKARIFVGAITGHLHTDGYYMYDGRFPVITTMCDANAQDATSKYAERTAGTVNEQAFDVVQIDASAKRIYMTRIGYGNDRTFSFGETGSGLITQSDL